MEAITYSFISGILSIEEMYHLRGGNDGPVSKETDATGGDVPDLTKD